MLNEHHSARHLHGLCKVAEDVGDCSDNLRVCHVLESKREIIFPNVKRVKGL